MVVPLLADRYVTILLTDIVCFALFAVSLHFIMGPAGMVSFGHAAYFGLGAYAAGLLLKRAGLPMEAALVLAPLAAGAFAVVYGWFCVRLSGVYLAMLTLAFAQISWSIVFQWDSFTGGSNGLFGIWPSAWLAGKTTYYYLALVLCGAGIALLWRVLFSPFGYALRAGRDSPLRAEAIGIDVRGFQWAAFVLVGRAAGLAGAVYAFSKGSISPSAISIAQSTDGLVMVLLGGVETLTGPVVGAAIFTWLRDEVARRTEFWRAVMGAVILLIVLLFPQGLVGGLKALTLRWREATRMTAVLQVEGLHKAFGGVQAVADVSFAVDAGELLALIGPNGAGKSTCFNMLNGQLAPDAGIVRLGGRDIVGLAAARRLAAGRRPHLPDHRHLRVAQRARQRADGALFPRRPAALAAVALWRRLHGGGRCAAGPGRHARPGRADLRRAGLWRPQAGRAGHGARQPAAAAADGRAHRRHGAARSGSS